MKISTIFLLLNMIAFQAVSQMDFSLFLDRSAMSKSYDKKFHNFKDYGSIECISGNCKNGFGVSRTHGNKFKVYIAGNFKNKKISGDASIFMVRDKKREISYIGKPYPYVSLEKSILNLPAKKAYTYYQKLADQSHESYYGTFSENVIVDNGLYTFKGTYIELGTRAIPIALSHGSHLKIATADNPIPHIPNDIDFTFRYKGNFKPLYGGVVASYALGNRDHYIEFKAPWLEEELLIKKHGIPNYFEIAFYNKASVVSREMLSFENVFGAIGWQREFVSGQDPKITIQTAYGPVFAASGMEYIDYVKGEPQAFNNGHFYGQMENGMPKGYGIFINEYFHYDGSFNEAGEFHGLGFVTIRKPIKKNDYTTEKRLEESGLLIKGYAIGIFKNGRLNEGSIVLTKFSLPYYEVKDRIKTQGVYQDLYQGQFNYLDESNTFVVKSEHVTSTTPEKLTSPLLEGSGHIYSSSTSMSYGVLSSKEVVYSKGNYLNSELNGFGVQQKRKGKGMWEGEFVNGIITEASRKKQEARENQEYAARRQATLTNTPLKLGTIVTDGNRNIYVNELNVNGCIEICSFPISINYGSKWEERINFSYIHRPLTSAFLLANPWYTSPAAVGEICGDEIRNFRPTNLQICNRCEGKGEITGLERKTGTSTHITSKVEKVYSGVYYDAYRTVSESKTVSTNLDRLVTRTCDLCNGAGCRRKE